MTELSPHVRLHLDRFAVKDLPRISTLQAQSIADILSRIESIAPAGYDRSSAAAALLALGNFIGEADYAHDAGAQKLADLTGAIAWSTAATLRQLQINADQPEHDAPTERNHT